MIAPGRGGSWHVKLAARSADSQDVGEVYLDVRLELLRRAQNADGGWGYFPGKQSWLEPTCYAILALRGRDDRAAARGWNLVRSWQLPDGSWRPAGQVQTESWGTALGVTLATVFGASDASFTKGLAWLLETVGADSGWLNRIVTHLHLSGVDSDSSLEGWPWKPGTAAWIEPTAHTLVALKKASMHAPSDTLHRRVRVGEEMILNRRCADGGWNYGNRAVLNVDLPSYPETTAVALLGLQGRPRKELAPALALAQKLAGQTRSLARAWLSICLRIYGLDPGVPPEGEAPPSPDLMLAALEALGAPGGNAKLLSVAVTEGTGGEPA